jgi:transcriptional regulator with XRE-family HTH domain
VATKLGEKLRNLRKEKDLTLERLGELSGLSKSYIWELENRESQRPSAEKLNALGKVLGVDAVFFIEDDVREPEQRHLDVAFYRDYQDLEAEDKERLRKIMDTFKKT